MKDYLIQKRKQVRERMIGNKPMNGNVHKNHLPSLIMLIEDNIDHAELIIRRISEHPIRSQVLHFQDGRSALDFLFSRNDFASLRPGLILLDLHLPDTNGIEILRTIKADNELKMIPVILLTTSAADGEIACAYSNHANSYLVKPVGGEEFKELIYVLCSYWLGNNRRPAKQGATREVERIS
jgi:CheY-like chemotaxis protein